MTLNECIRWHENYLSWADKKNLTSTDDAYAARIALEALRHCKAENIKLKDAERFTV